MPFERCYGCRMIWPEAELEGGLCLSCRGEARPSEPEPVPETWDIGAHGGDRYQTPRAIAAERAACAPDLGPLFGGRS
jgi:hypothetical protein